MRRCFSTSVHPRVCGEQQGPIARQSEIRGSSPRVRGTARGDVIRTLEDRFIPACAGNSGGTPCYWTDCPVHPRVCGEQNSAGRTLCYRYGSSPRVRGTETLKADEGGHLRFIPACAGNRIRPSHSAASRAVHPRVCGEQGLPKANPPYRNGSSPRVRGTDQARPTPPAQPRFIPACAGNSQH